MTGFAAVFLMGIVLGLLGGGGSILSVPIFVYLFKIPATVATGYSLFVVGVGAMVAAIQNGRKGLINYRVGAVFALPSIIGVYLIRRFGVPALPPEIMTWGDHTLTNENLIMLTFALVMIAAAFSMIRGRQELESKKVVFNYPLIAVEGLIVGGVTGFVGAGGGFIIIPALVVFAGLSVHTAIGTSLAIIAVKSLIGFLGDLQSNHAVDWQFLLISSFVTVIGIFVGTHIAAKVSPRALKKGFGYFVLVMGGFILLKQMMA